MNVTVRAKKVHEKKEIICLGSMFLAWVMVLCLKKWIFYQFCTGLSKKCKSVKATYMYASERSRKDLILKAYYAMTYCFGDIIVWSRKILLNFCSGSIFFDIVIANISRNVPQTPINHIIFWKSVMRTFRCLYVNYFNRLRLHAEVSAKLQNNAFFWAF